MKTKRVSLYLNAALAQQAQSEAIKRCPPHQFEAAWSSLEEGETHGGVIFCHLCGDVRTLAVPAIEAPEMEKVAASDRRIHGK